MIAQDFILKHIPFGDRIERNGNTYYYEVIDSKTGSFRLKTNSGDYEATSFSAFPDELKIGCEEVAIKQAEVKARSVETELRLNTITAWWSQIPKPKRNREAVADLFILFHKDRLCYSHELRQWLIYNGKFWDFDKAEAVYNFLIGFNKDIIKVIEGEFINPYDTGGLKLKGEAIKWSVGLNNGDALKDVLSIAAKKCAVSLAEFDTKDWLFNVKNGTIDLKTGYLHSHTPKDRITLICDVNYYKGAKYERWDITVLDACGGRADYVRYLQKEFGYGITGLNDEELLIMLLGFPLTGKSTFYEPVFDVIGDYGHYMAFNTLKSSDREGGTPREDLLRLRTCRLVMCSEVNPKTKFDTALVKKITSGEALVARGIHSKHSVEFTPKFKVVVGTNYSPIIPYDDGGSYRRIKVNPFKNTVASDKIDKAIKRTFKGDKAARERILAWLIEGCLMWQRDGLDTEPREVTRANSAYRREQNPLYQFIEDYCIADRFGRATVEQLVNAFNDSKAEYGADEISAKSLGRYMKPLEVDFKKGRDNKQRYYEGIRLKTLDELDKELEFDYIEQSYELEHFNETLERLCSVVKCGEWFLNVVTFDVYNATFPYLFLYNHTHKIINREVGFQTSNVTNVTNVTNVNQQQITQYFFEIFNKLKSAGGVANDQDTLLKVTSEKIKAEHPELGDYDVLGFGNRLVETDKEIQSVLADVTR